MTSSSTPWWSKDTIAVVTGANKGIGYETVRQLAEKGVTVVLTARDPANGQAAVDTLKADGVQSVWYHQLDVSSSESVKALATWLKCQFGGIDILVNNAGIGSGPGGNGNEISYENANAVMETNYYGVKRVTEGLLPLLRPGARVLSITSGLALYTVDTRSPLLDVKYAEFVMRLIEAVLFLSTVSCLGPLVLDFDKVDANVERLRSEKLKRIFRDEESYTPELIDSLATKLLEDVKAGRYDEEGWVPDKAPIYSDSKILMNAYLKVLARSLSKSQSEDRHIFVAIVSPGITLTDLLKRTVGTQYKPPAGFVLKTPSEGADTGVWLALLSKEEMVNKHGKIWHDREEYDWGREKLER